MIVNLSVRLDESAEVAYVNREFLLLKSQGSIAVLAQCLLHGTLRWTYEKLFVELIIDRFGTGAES